jgi:hypothetical protein
VFLIDLGSVVTTFACYSREGNLPVGRFPIPEFSIFGLTALQMAHVQGRGYSDVFFQDVRESAWATSFRKGTPPSIKGEFLAMLGVEHVGEKNTEPGPGRDYSYRY